MVSRTLVLYSMTLRCCGEHGGLDISIGIGYLFYPANHWLYALADRLLLMSSAQILRSGKVAVSWADEDSSRSTTTAAML